MTPADMTAEFIAAAAAWGRWSEGLPYRPLSSVPLAVLLASPLCAPADAPKMSGDIIRDLLGGILTMVDRMREDARGGMEFGEDDFLDLRTRIEIVVEIRRRERGAAPDRYPPNLDGKP